MGPADLCPEAEGTLPHWLRVRVRRRDWRSSRSVANPRICPANLRVPADGAASARKVREATFEQRLLAPTPDCPAAPIVSDPSHCRREPQGDCVCANSPGSTNFGRLGQFCVGGNSMEPARWTTRKGTIGRKRTLSVRYTHGMSLQADR